MANLSQIKSDSNWGDEALKINQNFSQINTEISRLSVVTNIKMPLFTSTSAATSAIPDKYVGQLVLISSTYELPAPIYRWSGSSWVSTGKNGGNATIPVSGYLTYETVKTTNEVYI